jgi:cytochrome c
MHRYPGRRSNLMTPSRRADAIIMDTRQKCRSAVAGLAITLLSVASLLGFPACNDAAQAGRDTPSIDRGRHLFERRCGGCHSLDADQTGPRLRNVYGRKAGSISGFRYSAALRSAGLTWDDALLDKWLTDPDSLIPGNEMDFSVPKADERAAIIRFLRLSSGK